MRRKIRSRTGSSYPQFAGEYARVPRGSGPLALAQAAYCRAGPEPASPNSSGLPEGHSGVECTVGWGVTASLSQVAPPLLRPSALR